MSSPRTLKLPISTVAGFPRKDFYVIPRRYLPRPSPPLVRLSQCYLLIWMFLGSFKSNSDIATIPLRLLPREWHQGLIVPGLTSAMATFLLRQFFLSIPQELEEAAIIDGASRFRIFAQIILPTCKPALLMLQPATRSTRYSREASDETNSTMSHCTSVLSQRS